MQGKQVKNEYITEESFRERFQRLVLHRTHYPINPHRYAGITSRFSHMSLHELHQIVDTITAPPSQGY